MVQCDKCDAWYHGPCVGLNSKEEAAVIKRWFCFDCRSKHGVPKSFEAEMALAASIGSSKRPGWQSKVMR